jgi:hypothetical protein
MLACYFGRIEIAKMLIKAGADQSVRNSSGGNILHAAVTHLPRARRLRRLLDLLDPELRAHLFKARSNLSDSGATPLHTWINAYCGSLNQRYYYNGPKYCKNSEITATLQLLLEYSKGAELEMLNGAGDTCLHTAVMNNAYHVVKGLLEFMPKLLHRENAVGRTPIELSREGVVAKKIVSPPQVQINSENKSMMKIVHASPHTFIKDDKAEETVVELNNKEEIWNFIHEFVQKHGDKRRLVSLNEANDVAKRLGEKYSAARYFSIQRRNEYADDSDEDENKEEKNKEDFAAASKAGKSTTAWRLKVGDDWVCYDCKKPHECDECELDK